VTAPPVYPPERHLLRDLRLEAEHRPDGSTGRIPIVPGVQTLSGAPHLGAVAVLVDAIGGGMAIPAALPNWIATADLTLHLIARPAEQSDAPEAVEGQGRVARAGSTTVVVEVDVVDVPSGAARGLATMTFAVSGRAAAVPVFERDPQEVSHTILALPESGLATHLEDALGFEDQADDVGETVVEIPLTAYSTNSFGALQGGAVGALVAGAAERALRPACGSTVEAVDLQLTYLEAGRVGPFRAVGTVLAASPSHGIARVVVRDAGARGLTTAWATVACESA
jgi:uncharacterized protein (TIGR00369 family)